MVADRPPSKRGNAEFQLLVEVSSRVSHREAAVGYKGMTEPERVFSCIWDLDSEVHSSGFEHYFGSVFSEHSVDAEDALRAIGAPQAADIVRQACAVFPEGKPPRDDDERRKLVDKLSDREMALLSALDEEFYKRPDDIETLLSLYIRAHAATFGIE